MCLISIEGKKKATCDIVCYKVVYHSVKAKVYWTPCKWVSIPYDVISGKRVFWGSGERDVTSCPPMYCVGSGYVHVFKKMPNKCTMHLFHSNVRYAEKLVYECIIKKGTEYWESFDGQELCARKIRFVKQII